MRQRVRSQAGGECQPVPRNLNLALCLDVVLASLMISSACRIHISATRCCLIFEYGQDNIHVCSKGSCPLRNDFQLIVGPHCYPCFAVARVDDAPEHAVAVERYRV